MALSGFNSDLIASLAGDTPVRSARRRLAVFAAAGDRQSAASAIFLAAIGAVRTVIAPALAVSVAQIVAALAQSDARAPARVRFADAPAPGLVAQFGAWPLACTFDRAAALGLGADADLASLLRDGLPSSDLLP
jgi:hypothetical protein